MAFKMKGFPKHRGVENSPMNKNGDPEKKEHSKKQELKESEKVSKSKESGSKKVNPQPGGTLTGSSYVPQWGKDIKNIAKTAISTHPAGIMYGAASKLFGKKSTITRPDNK